MTFTREITFDPAFDRRHADPKKNYGIHGAQMRWILKGDDGAIQFLVFTNWNLPHVQEELDARPIDGKFPHLLCRPMGADVGYHSRIPRYEGQEPMSGDCPVLGGKCFYDGSGLHGEEMLQVLIAEGSEAVWKRMEDYYHQTFDTEVAA